MLDSWLCHSLISLVAMDDFTPRPRYYTTYALRQNQGCTSACPWITAMVANYALTSPTLSTFKIETCIREGTEQYRTFLSLPNHQKEPFCGRQSGFRRTATGDLEPLSQDELDEQSSSYYTIDAAIKHLRAKNMLSVDISVGEEVFGFKLPPHFPQSNIPPPFMDKNLGYKLSLHNGIHQFVIEAAKQPVGQPLCAALSINNHIITLMAVSLTEDSVRYYAIDSLLSTSDNGKVHNAELAESSLEMGLQQYLAYAFDIPNEVPTATQVSKYTALMQEMLTTHNINDPRLLYSLSFLRVRPSPRDVRTGENTLPVAPTEY